MEVSLAAFRKRFIYNQQSDLLGNGGFSQVYKAFDNEDKIYVALKIYQGDPHSKYNLINEVKRFKKLRHPNIIEHIEAYEVNTGAFDIHGNPVQYQVGILEYADSGTLGDLLKKGKPDFRLLENITKDIIEGLAYLHDNNIIHRDLKPSNILLFKQGENLRAKITDFGIAKNTDATAASTQLVGTVEYMAPEFFKNDTAGITLAADLWSLGVILLEALTGIHPFGKAGTGSTSEQIIHNILLASPVEAQNSSSFPEPLKSIITNCLRRDPNLRPTTAADLKHYFDGKREDVFGERTQLIDTKFKKAVAETQKSKWGNWLRALYDFDLRKGKWKWVIAKEILVLLVTIALVIFFYQLETKRLEYSYNNYLHKFHSELIKDFYPQNLPKGFELTSFSVGNCPNYEGGYIAISAEFDVFKSELYKTGDYLAQCLGANPKYRDLISQRPRIIPFFIVTNFPYDSDVYSFYFGYSSCALLDSIMLVVFTLFYPIRFLLLILAWVFKTLGFTLPDISKKTSKTIKYTVITLFAVLLVILFFASQQKQIIISSAVNSEKAPFNPNEPYQKLVNGAWVNSAFVDTFVAEVDSSFPPSKLNGNKSLPTPQVVFGKNDPVYIPNKPSSNPSLSNYIVILMTDIKYYSDIDYDPKVGTKEQYDEFKSLTNSWTYIGISEVLNVASLNSEKEYRIQQYILSQGLSVADLTSHRQSSDTQVKIYKFKTFESALKFREQQKTSKYILLSVSQRDIESMLLNYNFKP